MTQAIPLRWSTFADLLKHHRLSAGWTQEELAERAHLSLRAVSDLERGERLRPRRQTVQLLVDGLRLEASGAGMLLAASRQHRERDARSETSPELPESAPTNLLILAAPRAVLQLRICLLGRFSVESGTRSVPVDTRRHQKAATLIKLLTLAPGHRIQRVRLLEFLWPSLSGEKAANRLYRTIDVASRILEPTREVGAPSTYLGLVGEQVVLTLTEAISIDVDDFVAAAAVAERSPDPALCAAALAVYPGDLLPEDGDEDWVVAHRKELRRRAHRLLQNLAHFHNSAVDDNAPIQTLSPKAAVLPTDEVADVGLPHHAANVGTQGLPEFDLNALPSGSMAASISRAAPIVTTTDLGVDALLSMRHNLPFQSTTFIGRERELVEVAARLRATRILTLTGTGGCGKTRLAVEVARDLLKVYPDGAWFLELAAVADSELIPSSVAAAVGLRVTPGEQIVDTLTSYLRPKHLLLVIDNCEHLLDGVARTIDHVIRSCPGVQVLATSREPLAIAGEVVWRLPSLTTPPPNCLMDMIGDYEAVRLFVARAKAVQQDFALTEQNVLAVARICERLDGIPLAIELASARVAMLTPYQIARRLDDCFRLLTGGARLAIPRHQTIRATIDWSYDLLGNAERILFRRLAVFAGGFTLEAAEAVCVDVNPKADPRTKRRGSRFVSHGRLSSTDVLNCLAALVARSLVLMDATSNTGRYRLLETTRQYAWKRLVEAHEVPAWRSRHCDWFLAFAERGEIELRGAAQGEWLRWLEAERDNFRAVLEWCETETDQTEAGLRLASALWWFWFIRDRLTEGLGQLERLLARAEGGSVAVQAGALWRAAYLALWSDALVRSEELAERALCHCRELGDDYGTAWAFDVLAWTAQRRGNPDLARERLRRSAALFRGVGEAWAIAFVVVDLAKHGARESMNDIARDQYAEALTIWRSLGDVRGIATVLRSLAFIAYQQEDYAAARPLYEETVQLARDSTNTLALSYGLVGLGDTLHQLGDFAGAESCLTEAVELARVTGNRERGASALWSLGLLLRTRQRHREAIRRFRESLALYVEIGSPDIRGTNSIIMSLLEGIAGYALREGKLDQSARLFGATNALNRAVNGNNVIDHDPAHGREVGQNLDTLRALLSPAAIAEAWAAGQSMTIEQAIDDALHGHKIGPVD